jgi:hypothetical protein
MTREQPERRLIPHLFAKAAYELRNLRVEDNETPREIIIQREQQHITGVKRRNA